MWKNYKNTKPSGLFFQEKWIFQINPTLSCDQNVSIWAESGLVLIDTFLLKEKGLNNLIG